MAFTRQCLILEELTIRVSYIFETVRVAADYIDDRNNRQKQYNRIARLFMREFVKLGRINVHRPTFTRNNEER